MKILRCKPGFRMQHQVKISLGHRLILFVIPASGNLMNSLHPGLMQKLVKLTVIHKRRKKSKKIDHISFFLLRFQKRIQRLPHMDHRRLSAFTGQRVHVAWPHRNIYLLLCFSADTLHISSKKCIHASDADHHNRRLFLTTVADLLYCLWDFLQMTASNNIRLIHHQVKKSVIVFRHGTDKRCISATASWCHNEHNRVRHCKPCTLHAESFCTWRIKCQSFRRTVDQMLPRDHLRRNRFQPVPGQFFHCCKICFLFHTPSFLSESVSETAMTFSAVFSSAASPSLSSSFRASAKNFSLISELSSPSITVFP